VTNILRINVFGRALAGPQAPQPCRWGRHVVRGNDISPARGTSRRAALTVNRTATLELTEEADVLDSQITVLDNVIGEPSCHAPSQLSGTGRHEAAALQTPLWAAFAGRRGRHVTRESPKGVFWG
jgi:hypothetical protein